MTSTLDIPFSASYYLNHVISLLTNSISSNESSLGCLDIIEHK